MWPSSGSDDTRDCVAEETENRRAARIDADYNGRLGRVVA